MKKIIQRLTGVHKIHHIYWSYGYKIPLIKVGYFKYGFKSLQGSGIDYHDTTIKGD